MLSTGYDALIEVVQTHLAGHKKRAKSGVFTTIPSFPDLLEKRRGLPQARHVHPGLALSQQARRGFERRRVDRREGPLQIVLMAERLARYKDLIDPAGIRPE